MKPPLQAAFLDLDARVYEYVHVCTNVSLFISMYVSMFTYTDTTLQAADLDLDGDMDLVQLSTANGALWMENDGQGTFTLPGHTISSAAPPEVLALGDVDDDGDVDVLLSQDAALVTVPNVGDVLGCTNKVLAISHGEASDSRFLRCAQAKGGAGTGFAPAASMSCMTFLATRGQLTSDTPSDILTPVSVGSGSWSSALSDGSVVKEEPVPGVSVGFTVHIKDSSDNIKAYSTPCV